MLKVHELVPPSTDQFDIAIKGMRNAFKSWNKNDSGTEYSGKGDTWGARYALGINDKNLLFALCNLGTSDRKVLRQLPVIMNITATGTWWRQMDQYKIGTVTNSTSQMHTLLNKDFEKSDFSFDRLYDSEAGQATTDKIIEELNTYREAYFNIEDEVVKELVWHQIFEMIPQSFNYYRTWSGNYEVLVTIFQQRFNHDQPEWNVFLTELIHRLPYYSEILEALGLIRIKSGKVEGYDSYHKKWSYLCEE